MDIQIIHDISEFYSEIYKIGSQLSKHNKLGLHAKIESLCLVILELSIKSALSARDKKIDMIREIRIKTEVIKRLVRVSNSLKIIDDKKYIFLQGKLQEISKQATSWQEYLTQNPVNPPTGRNRV